MSRTLIIFRQLLLPKGFINDFLLEIYKTNTNASLVSTWSKKLFPNGTVQILLWFLCASLHATLFAKKSCKMKWSWFAKSERAIDSLFIIKVSSHFAFTRGISFLKKNHFWASQVKIATTVVFFKWIVLFRDVVYINQSTFCDKMENDWDNIFN